MQDEVRVDHEMEVEPGELPGPLLAMRLCKSSEVVRVSVRVGYDLPASVIEGAANPRPECLARWVVAVGLVLVRAVGRESIRPRHQGIRSNGERARVRELGMVVVRHVV